jgi:hypothetical protein
MDNDRREVALATKEYGPDFLRAYNRDRRCASHRVALGNAIYACRSKPEERARRERDIYRYAKQHGLTGFEPTTTVVTAPRPTDTAPRARQPRPQATRSSVASGDGGSDDGSHHPERALGAPTQLEARAHAIRVELSSALGLPEFHQTTTYLHYRWHCAVCRSNLAGDYRPLVLDATIHPPTVECEYCRCRDPHAQVDAVRGRERLAELADIANAAMALLDKVNASARRLEVAA